MAQDKLTIGQRVFGFFIVLLAISGLAYGQTTQDDDSVVGVPANVIVNENNIRLVTTPLAHVALQGEAPVAADFRVVGQTSDNQDGQPDMVLPTEDYAGITMRGYVRYVDSENGRIGQIIVVGLEKNGATGRLDGFGAAWPLPEGTDELTPDQQLAIEGNRLALTQALGNLETPAQAEDTNPEKQQISPVAEPVSDQVGQSSSGGEKSDYQTPAPAATKPESTTETAKAASGNKPERACIDGAIRVDTELGVAFERRQVWIPSKNAYADCYDSQKPSERYALKKNYASCAVGIEGDKATSRFQRYYTKAGAIKLVGVCVDDPDLTFDITENHAGCQVQINETQAIPHADLGYTNRAGRRVQTRGCAPSTTKAPVHLVTMTDECNIRHSDNKAVIRGVETYTLDGVTHQVGVCKDTDTIFEHVTDFEGCSVDVDIKRKRATARSRTIYRNGNGEAIEVRGCRPDQSRTFAITEDMASCDVVIDYAANKAVPQARLIYLDHERSEIEVRGCAPATASRAVTLASDTSACAMRHDFAGLRTHERATYSYQLGGGTFTAATCRETGRNYALVKDYAACQAEIEERAGGHVVTKFRWGYQDASQRKQFASECAPDPELIAGVSEDHASCTISIDYDTGQATPQARLVYSDRNGQVREIRGCAASTSKRPARLSSNVNACEAGIDLRNSLVTEQASYSYSLDGEIKQASGCRDTGQTFDLTRDYESCETVIDLDSKRATDHFRLVYRNGNRETVEAKACAPDSARQFTITEDFNTCDVAVDYTASTATPHAKLVYQNSDRKDIEVRGCDVATSKRAVTLTADKSSCNMRMDIPGLKIYEQAAYSYSLDNARHEASACRDTGISFALVKDYDGCSPDIDIVSQRVTTHARWSYLDKRGRRQAASECATEQELVFDIVEDHVACKIDVDFKTGTATPQARLVYSDRLGQERLIRGCAASSSKPAINLAPDIAACEADIDFRRLNVKERASYSYSLDGEIKQVSGCRDTGQTFDLSRDYESCETVIDLDSKRATDHFRLVYRNGNRETVEAKACAPDSARQFTITEDFNTCDVAVDYTASTATPHAKLVYQNSDRKDIEVRGCDVATSKRTVALTADSSNCDMRMDLVEGRIHARATYSYQLDGGRFTPATCRETGQNFPLVKDYAACTIDVDVPRKTATQHFRWAYQDAGRKKQFASSCAPDPELVFAIVEDQTTCPISIDYEAETATPQARLIYTDRNSQTTEVRGCGASTEKRPVRLTAKTAGCSARADSAGGKVYELASYSYRLDGEIKQASDCRETGRMFELSRDYESCEIVIDLDSKRATDHFRLVYRNGKRETVEAKACAPDRNRQFAITEDFNTCDVAVDYTASTATPHAKLVYQNSDRKDIEVRGCDVATSKRAVTLTADSSNCDMRMDLVEGRIHARATYSYQLDGGRFTPATCRETGQNFPLVKDYAACTIDVDAPRKTATQHFRWAYLDAGRKKQFASSCAPDPELVFAIVEDQTTCPISIDYETGLATPQARLIYTDRNSQTTEVRGCGASTEKRPVRLTAKTTGCSARADSAGGKVYELASYSYRLDGEIKQASACRETGRTFDLTPDHEACDIDIDTGAMRATGRYQLVYNDGDGQRQTIGACQADRSRVYTIREDKAGCTIKIDYETKQAIPQSKLVYNGFGGRAVEVRSCAASTSQQAVALTLDKDACEMRYDYTGRKAHEKATYSYELSGGAYIAATCRETGDSFVMDKSYSTCSIATNLTTLKAQARYKWFYVDGAGDNQDVGDCVPDPELVFDIREDNTACKIFLDYEALRAVPQALLYYNNQHGQRTEIRGCEASNSISPVRMISRTDVCQLRHDMSAGKSYELGIHTYLLNGIVYQASTCTDTGRFFAHTKTYLGESRQNLCDPIINRTSKQVTKQYRMQITVNGRKQFVSECTPDTSSKLAIKSTTDGCADPASWQHDLGAGITYGMERFYYQSSTGGRTYVSGCQNAATTYRHDHTITGYQYNDAQLTAWPTTRVTITAPTGAYVVDAGRVLPGATQIPYVKLTTVDEVSGESRYEGCNAYRLTNRYERWRRPDKSIYNKPIGAGAARGPEAVCRTEIAPWRLTGSRKADFDGTETRHCKRQQTEGGSWQTRGCRTYYFYRASAEYLGNRKLIREDGTTVTNNTVKRWHQFVRVEKSWLGHHKKTFSIDASFTGKHQPPATMTGSQTSSWEQNLGWR